MTAKCMATHERHAHYKRQYEVKGNKLHKHGRQYGGKGHTPAKWRTELGRNPEHSKA